MQKYLFFSHRHEKEAKELIDAFKHKSTVSDQTLKKLDLTMEYDFRESAINQAKQLSFDKRNALNETKKTKLLGFIVDQNNVVSYINCIFDKSNAIIMMIETASEYRNRGLAGSLLDSAEEILIDKMKLQSVGSGVTKDSIKLFAKRGYSIMYYTPEEMQKYQTRLGNISSELIADITLTKEQYYYRKANQSGLDSYDYALYVRLRSE